MLTIFVLPLGLRVLEVFIFRIANLRVDGNHTRTVQAYLCS